MNLEIRALKAQMLAEGDKTRKPVAETRDRSRKAAEGKDLTSMPELEH
jgi:hypothetical protein